MDTVGSMISTFGFPIVCCIFLAWYVLHSTDKYTKMIENLNTQSRDDIMKINEQRASEVRELNNMHKEETNGLKDALNNIALALQQLSAKLDGKDGD